MSPHAFEIRIAATASRAMSTHNCAHTIPFRAPSVASVDRMLIAATLPGDAPAGATCDPLAEPDRCRGACHASGGAAGGRSGRIDSERFDRGKTSQARFGLPDAASFSLALVRAGLALVTDAAAGPPSTRARLLS